jgi:CBS domain-containing protein
VGAVPVVRPETGELIGIVSYVDVLRAVRHTLDDA